MSHFSKRIQNTSAYSHGFTLVELVVTLGIVVVILSVIMMNQSQYVEGAILNNLADDIGLTFSQAQAYGIGVKESLVGSADFSAAYGMTVNLLSNGSNMASLFFADKNGDHVYNGDWTCPIGGSSECLEKKTITRGNYIDRLCLVLSFGENECTTPKRTDIVYIRPNTEAQITLFDSTGSVYNPVAWLGVKIVFKSPSGLSRAVIIYKSGQISVQ